MFQALRHHNVRVFLAGQAVSDVGTWFQLIAIPWAILAATDDSSKVGIALALQFTPALLIGAFTGVVIDRVDRRTILTLDAAIAGTASAVVGIVILNGSIEIWLLYLLAFISGTVRAFDEPARYAFVAELVDRHELANAVSLNSAERNIARVISPAITGITIAALGVGWCFVINAVSFLPVIATIRMLRPKELRLITPIPRQRGQFVEGLRFAWSVPIVRTAIMMSAIIGMLTLQYLQVMAPVLVKEVLREGAGSLSIVLLAAGVAGLLGALLSARGHWKPMVAMTGACAVMCLASVACGLASSVLLLTIAIMPISGAVIVFHTRSVAATQLSVPRSAQGRVLAILALSTDGLRPLGALGIGLAMSTFNERAGMFVGGLGAGAATLLGGAYLVRERRAAPR